MPSLHPDEIIKIIAACNAFDRQSLIRRPANRRRSALASAGQPLMKRALKNGRMIRVDLPSAVLEALERLPIPSGAAANSPLYFSSTTASVRSLVKGAQRTMRWYSFAQE